MPLGRAQPPLPTSVFVFAFLLGVFFLSGASALIYEVVWTRLLSLVFGVTLYAISAVLSSFMAGLALGSFLAGKVADHLRRPLLYYAAMEVAIGLLGLVSLAAIKELTPLYTWLYHTAGDSLPLATSARFLAACGIMLLPTSLMGATLPFMVKASLSYLPKVGENVSLLYGLNTAGAALGVLVGGFFLIGQLGFQGSVYVAALLNMSAGLTALILVVVFQPLLLSTASAPSMRATPQAPGETAASLHLRGAVFLGLGLSGFCALAYEVIWFRILDLFLNGTVYAFSIMLFIFLAGLAIGSALTRVFIGRSWNWLAVLGALELLIGMEAIFSEYALGKVPSVQEAATALPALAPLLGRPVFSMTLAAALILLPLTILLGMTFPVAAQAVAQERRQVGALIGGLNASNTVGAILGSLAGAFWLIPFLGSQRSLTLLATVNLGIALALGWLAFSARPRLRWALPVAGLALFYPGAAPDMLAEVFQGIFKGHQLLWYEEGLENTVSVQKHPTGFTVLYLNNRAQAFDLPAMAGYHQLIGHLPMWLHPAPQDVLVIGLGGGATPGAVSRYKESQVRIVELSPSVVRAAAHFGHINNNVLQQDNVRLTIDDGRNYLLLTNNKYDVITADIIQPHHVGSGNLYSVEYFQLAKNALNEGGLMVQWVNPGPATYPLIVRTFLSVFPHVTFWYNGSLMVGSKEPLNPVQEAEALERRFNHPSVKEAAQALGLANAEALRSQYNGDHDTFGALVGPGLLLTDDRPLTEYFRSAPGTVPPALQQVPILQ